MWLVTVGLLYTSNGNSSSAWGVWVVGLGGLDFDRGWSGGGGSRLADVDHLSWSALTTLRVVDVADGASELVGLVGGADEVMTATSLAVDTVLELGTQVDFWSGGGGLD